MKQKLSFKLRSILFKKQDLKESGQVTVEYLLLAVVLLVLFQVSTNTFKNNDSLKNFQETPRNIFKNMVENGNWEPTPDKSRKLHPNHYESQYTANGEGPP